jgi:transducin (beta)-like 1
MSIGTDEICLLIERYMHECGFQHSLYTFNAETGMDFTSIDGSMVPPGALITMLQKGLLYAHLEREMMTGDSDMRISLLDAALWGGAMQRPEDAPTTGDILPLSSLVPRIKLEDTGADIKAGAFGPEGHFFVTGQPTGSLTLYSDEGARALAGEAGESKLGVTALDISSGGLVLVGRADGSWQILDQVGSTVTEGSESGPIAQARWDPSGARFFLAQAGAGVALFGSDGEEEMRLRLRRGAVGSSAWRDDAAFALPFEDGCVVVWEAGDQTTLPGHTGSANCVVWGDSFLASGGDDGTVQIFEGDERWVLEGHTEPVVAVGFAEGALASSSMDHSVRIWDVTEKACARVLSAHTAPVMHLRFVLSGTVIASGSLDETVRFWRVSDGRPLLALTGSGAVSLLESDGGFHVALATQHAAGVVLDLQQLPQVSAA